MAVCHLMTFPLSFLHERFSKSNNKGVSRCFVSGMPCANNPLSEIFSEHFPGTWDLVPLYNGVSEKQYTNISQNQYTNNIKIHILNSIGSFHKNFLLLMLKAVQLQCICAPVLYSLLMMPPIVSNLVEMGRCKSGLILKTDRWKEIAKEQMWTEQINIPCYFWACIVFFL